MSRDPGEHAGLGAPAMAESVVAGGRALASFSWLSIGLLASRLLQFGAIVYLTRVLGDGGFGRFIVAQSFLWYGVILTDLGLSPIGTREVAREPGRLRSLLTSIHGIRLASFALQMLLLTTLLWLLPVDAEMRWLFVLSFASLLAYAMSPDWAFRGLERMEYVAAWEALPRLAWLAGCLWLVEGREDLLRVPLIRMIGEVGTVGLLLAALAWRIRRRDGATEAARVRARHLLAEAAPIAATSLLVQVYFGLDVILLGLLESDETAGQYGAVYRVVPLLLTGTYLLGATYQPILARHLASDRAAFRRHLDRALAGALLLGTVAPAAVALAAGPVVRLLFGAEYAPAAVPLAVLMVAMPFAYLGVVYGTTLVAAGLQGRMLIAAATAAAVNVAANLILIPLAGMTGAAIAAVLSYGAGWFVQWRYVSRLVAPTPMVPVGTIGRALRAWRARR